MSEKKTAGSLVLPDTVLENMTTLGDDSNPWVKCLACGEEYKTLDPSGVCMTCILRQEEKEKTERVLETRLKDMIGLKGAAEFRFERYRVTPGTERAFAASRNFLPDGENLFMFGPAGTGKTHLSGAITRKWLWERGDKKVEFYKVPRFLRWFRLRKPSEQDEELDRLSKLHVLVLDDMGVEKDSEHALGILYELIDSRDMARRNGLVITSNLSAEDLAKKMDDDRLPSRIFGMCKVYRLEASDGRIGRARGWPGNGEIVNEGKPYD